MPKGLALGIELSEDKSSSAKDVRSKAEELSKQASNARKRLFESARDDAAKKLLKAFKGDSASALREAMDEYLELERHGF